MPIPRLPRPVVVVAAILLPTIAFFALRARFVERFESWTGPAEWIWWSNRIVRPEPKAFVAARAFTLSKTGPAELRVSGDREFVVYLNGNRIGGGRGGKGFPLRRYEVGSLLVRGENRIAIELRSPDSVGGAIASLSIAGLSEWFLATDSSWSIHDDWEEGVRPGRVGVRSAGKPAASWGRPPMNPWGYPKPSRLERIPRSGTAAHEAVRLESTDTGVRRLFRVSGGGEASGILVIRFEGRGARVFRYAVFRAAELSSNRAGSTVDGLRGDSVGICPAGKGYWDSVGRVTISALLIESREAGDVSTVEVVPSEEPVTF